MATSTAISGIRPSVRTGVSINNNIVAAVALDYANGQTVASGSSSAASAVFDANNDRLVQVSASAAIYFTVAPSPTAAAGTAGNDYLGAGGRAMVYVPATCKIAVIEDSAAGHVQMIPALISS